MKKIFILLSFIFLMLGSAFSQNDNAQYQQALKLKNDNKFEESLAAFNQLLKNDSSKVDYLHNTSYLLCKLGNRQKTETERQDYFHRAEYLSKKAIAIDNKSAEA